MRARATRYQPTYKEARRLQVGGTLHPHEHIYIQRPEDEEVLRLLLAGDYVNVLTSRQMGKSSLMTRACYALQDRGVRFASIDLAGELGSGDDPTIYYRGLLQKIARDLELEIDLKAWWQQHDLETNNQKLLRFFKEEVGETIEAPVVIFLDEIDSTLKLPFTDDLFTSLRTMTNGRAFERAYQRLTFCLLGVATPNELIKDRRTTPYNVGRTLELRDFDAKRDDLTPLALALHADLPTGHALLDRVLHWTGGHPYLTNRLCHDLAEAGVHQIDEVDRHVEATFRTLDRVNSDVHVQQILRFVEERFSKELETLDLFTNIIRGERERDQPSLTHAELKLSGLVKRNDQGCLIVRNKIYKHLFDKAWVASTRPKRTLARTRLYAMAASLALVLALGAGVLYQLMVVRPEQQALAARQQLEKFKIAVFQSNERDGYSIQFPKETEQVLLEKAAPILLELPQDVVDLTLSHAKVLDLGPLAQLPELQVLNLSHAEVRNFTSLSKLSKLQVLDLSDTPVANLHPLSSLTGLQTLDLSDTQVSDLDFLSNFHALDSLDLSNTQIDDLSPLLKLGNLDRLDLSHTQTSNLLPIANLIELDSLDISHTQVSKLAPISNLKELSWLDLSNTQVSNLESLSRLTSLETLIVYSTQISNLAALSGLGRLRKLSLYNTQTSELAPLSKLTSLRSVDLSSTLVSDLAPLLRLPALESLIAINIPVTPPEYAMFKLEYHTKNPSRPFFRGP